MKPTPIDEDTGKNGLVFNSCKCHIIQPQISSYEAIFSVKDEA